MEMMKWLGRILALMAITGVGWWLWQRVFVTEETRIRQLISRMEQAVERNNLLKLQAAIAQDYSDDFGLDKSTLLGAVRAFRQQYDRMFIHISDLTITVAPDKQTAQAILIAKVLATTRSSVGETEVRAERFRLFFRKTDEGWKMIRAETPQLRFD
jgi:ketosteroid isomerase-like protein